MTSSAERRKGFWDENEDDNQEEAVTSLKPGHGASPEGEAVLLNQKVHEASVLLEQTHQLYLQYFNGVARTPPVEKSQLLEKKTHELQQIANQTTSAKFKVTQFAQQYTAMKELWARKLREKEKK